MSSKFDFTPWHATKFFFPLAIQAMSQSLTYPLVGIVVAHGALGAKEFAAFAQGLMIMFLLGTIGYGLITTGMVYAKDRIGYVRFRQVNLLMIYIESALQCSLALPLIAPFVFGKLLGLSGEQLEIARWSMLFSLPAQIGFFLRNIPQVVLYNQHDTGIANTATLLRIVLTALVAVLFYYYGLVGWGWGCVCFNIPVLLETVCMWAFARKAVRALPLKLLGTEKVTQAKIFFFNIPLSMGGFFLMFAVFMLNAIINRTDQGPIMLAIHLIAIGLINPLSYGALRNQAVAIGFPQSYPHDHRTFFFALWSGVALSLTLLIIQIPCVSRWYFCSVQNLELCYVPFAKNALWIAMIFPILQAMRGHAEGLAAYRRRPNAVLAGQAVFFGVLLATLLTLWLFNVPGYCMGILSLCMASAATLITIHIGLKLAQFAPQDLSLNEPHR